MVRNGIARATLSITALSLVLLVLLVSPAMAAPAGLVAAYGFDVGGATLTDLSGNGHTGTISGATWTAAGRFGGALSFNGASNLVTVNDSNLLDLTTGMTLEAWVQPTALSGWRTVVIKERPGNLAYALYANTTSNRPSSEIATPGNVDARGSAQLPLNSWSHLAATYNGSTLSLYINGSLVSSKAVSGAIAGSALPLRIGGNSVWGEYFQGLIDEVRVYNRALSQAEIQSDMNTPATPPVPDFSFTVSPGTQVIPTSGTIYFDANVVFLDGFNSSNIQFWITDLPAGVTGIYTPNPGPHQGRSALAVTSTNASVGTYLLTLGATAEGITHSQNVTLIVSDTPDFNLVVYPLAQNTVAGSSVPYELTLASLNGFASPVSFSVAGLPFGATPLFTPQSATPPDGGILTVTTSTATPEGEYALTITATSGSLAHQVPVTLRVVATSGTWNLSLMGSMVGIGSNSLRVGSPRNDGATRVYVAPIETGRVIEHSWNGSSWTKLDVGGSPQGQEIHNFNIGPGRGDGLNRLYVASLDKNVYELSYNGAAWTQMVVGALDAEAMHTAVGIGRNDGVVRVYAVSTATAYEFTWTGSNWSKVVVGPVPAAHSIVIGPGRNNSLNNLYIASTGFGTSEARYVNGSWIVASMNDGGDVRNLSLGNGRNDGVNRIYGALWQAGQVRELTWDGTKWSVTSTTPVVEISLIHAYVLSGRNDGVNRVYGSGANGHAWEFTWNGSGWTVEDMGGGGGYIYGFHFGPARNDGVLRLYGAERDTGNQVYEYKWSSALVDMQPPTPPGALNATGSIQSVILNWSASSDNVGVQNYNVHRSTSPGFTPSAANRIAQPSGTTYTNTGLAPGTYYYVVTAQDAAGNVSAPSNQVIGTALADTTPPIISSVTVSPGNGTATITWTTDEASDSRVDYGTVPTSLALNATNAALVTAHSITLTGLAPNTTYYYRVTSKDAATNSSTSPPVANSPASFTTPSGAPNGLVAAYSFNSSGTTVTDLSGNGNTGAVSGATWTASGKFGGALSFNGTSNLVTVNDSNSLDLTTGMTLEAWVRPTTLSGWRTVLLKERQGDLAYAIYANTSTNRPSGEIATPNSADTRGSAQLALNTWSHIALTYSGTILRLYVNGVQASSRSVSGSITTSTGALRIGGNAVWGEYFAGQIDEVRVYNRVLSQAEIQTDMNTPLAP
ncbi:MAG TPA: LamG-like jellyroll fold domain-containing protein [Methylomirabilota bacterium]|nr:LamG-like jellyroll fold domain-containing protein [Methylomirabilota bacterium]